MNSVRLFAAVVLTLFITGCQGVLSNGTQTPSVAGAPGTPENGSNSPTGSGNSGSNAAPTLFAYVSDWSGLPPAGIYGVSVSGANASLIKEGSLYDQQQTASHIAAGKDFLFTSDGGEINSWKIDPTSGALAKVATTTLGFSTYLTTDASGRYLYTAGNPIYAFSVQEDGRLSALPGSPYHVSALIDGNPAITSDGLWFCGVAPLNTQQSQIDCLSRDSSTGALQSDREVTSSTYEGGFILAGAAASHLIVAQVGDGQFSKSVNVFSITSSNITFQTSVHPGYPVGVSTNKDGTLVAVADQDGAVDLFSFDVNSSTLQNAASTPMQTVSAVAISPDGKYVIATGASGAKLQITVFTTNGGLSQVSASPLNVEGNSQEVVIAK